MDLQLSDGSLLIDLDFMGLPENAIENQSNGDNSSS